MNTNLNAKNVTESSAIVSVYNTLIVYNSHLRVKGELKKSNILP